MHALSQQTMFEPAPASQPMQMRPYQEGAIQQVRQLIREGNRSILVVSPTGCHREGQGILMFDGVIRKVETVRVGDRLMGPDSRPRIVRELRRGRQQMARIVPTKGDSFVVNLDHVLTLVRTNEGDNRKDGTIVDVTVRHWLEWSRTQKHLHKMLRTGVEFDVERTRPLPLDPYFLGVLLGDGSMITRTAVSSVDPEIAEECQRQAVAFGLRCRVEKGHTVPSYHLVGQRKVLNPIREILRDLGLWGHHGRAKFIPQVYKVASRNDRLAILAGLIDTDGSLSRCGFDYISQSETLSRDVAFIARSLGLAAYVSGCEKRDQNGGGGTYWRVSISGECGIVPTRLPRKKAPTRKQIKSVLRTGFRVELLDEEDYFGFTLDSDGRYLLDDFTITHNSGKTCIFSYIVAEVARRGQPVLILAHRRELINQTVKKVIAAGVPRHLIGVIMGDDPRRNPHALVQIASIDTLRNKPTLPPAKVVIIDEAHRALSPSYVQLSERYPDAIKLGFTATPWRLDGKGLGRMYGELVVVASVQQLIDEGFLVRPRVFTHPVRPDLSKVAVTSGGDYDEEQLAAAVDKAALIGNIVEHYRQHASGLRAFAFAASVEHSIHIADAFNAAGITAEHVDGTTDSAVRDAALERFRSGQTMILANCSVYTEGTDVPECKCIILARPTKSRILYFQCGGRALRPVDGHPEITTAIILDHGGCAVEFGRLQDPQEYSLGDVSKRRGSVKSEAAVRLCPNCYFAMPTRTRECEECHYTFPIEPRQVEQRDGQLVEMKPSEDPAARELRATIQTLTISIDRTREWRVGETNRRLWDRYRKSRTEMTTIELRGVLHYLSSDGFTRDNPLPVPPASTPDWLKRAADIVADVAQVSDVQPAAPSPSLPEVNPAQSTSSGAATGEEIVEWPL